MLRSASRPSPSPSPRSCRPSPSRPSPLPTSSWQRRRNRRRLKPASVRSSGYRNQGLARGGTRQAACLSIRTVEDLVERALPTASRAVLARELEIDVKQLTEWVTGGLMRSKGVGTEMANRSKKRRGFVRSSTPVRQPAFDAERATIDAASPIGASLAQIEAWIAEAKTLAGNEADDRYRRRSLTARRPVSTTVAARATNTVIDTASENGRRVDAPAVCPRR